MISAFWRERFDRWLLRRIPPARRVTLNQKCIFIVPSSVGYAFLLVAFLVFLAAINYQNSLSYVVSFFMIGLFLVTMLHTWRNLAGVTVSGHGGELVPAGQDAGFSITVQAARKRSHHGIQLGWQGPLITAEPGQESDEVTLWHPTRKRGWLRPDRLKVSTGFPLGLFQAWSRVDLKLKTLVYPAPDQSDLEIESLALTGQGEGAVSLDGNEDFAGLRETVPTDPLAHISWKSFSRTGELLTKQFHGYSDERFWLDFRTVSGHETEEKLSRLCGLVLHYADQPAQFGLWLPDCVIEPDQGEAHVQDCLTALALFGTVDANP